MLKKPLKKKEKIVVKTPSNLVRRYPKKIRRKKQMRGGAITPELNKTLTDFLIERTETIYNLKIILLDRLCDAIIDKTRKDNVFKLDYQNHNQLYIQFRDKKGLYDYDLNKNYINFFGHSYVINDTRAITDIYNGGYQDIDNIVYILKIMNNIYSLLKVKPIFKERDTFIVQEFSINENDEPIRNKSDEKFIEGYAAYKKAREETYTNFPKIDSLLNPIKEEIKTKITKFLNDNIEATYNLKIQLLDKLSIILMDDQRADKFNEDSARYYAVYISFDAYNLSLYDYNLYRFIHDCSDDAYDDINEIIYILKIINNIYSLVKKEYKDSTEEYHFVPEKRWLLETDYRRPKDKEAFKINYAKFKDSIVDIHVDKIKIKTTIENILLQKKLREVFRVEWDAKLALTNFIEHINKEGLKFSLERKDDVVLLGVISKSEYVLKYEDIDTNEKIKDAIGNINNSLKNIQIYYQEALRIDDKSKINDKIKFAEMSLNNIIEQIYVINNEIKKNAPLAKGGNIAKYKNPFKKKDVKFDKQESIKNIAKYFPKLAKGGTIYASDLYNTIKSLNKMRGGMSEELIKKYEDFLTKFAEKTNELKYKLLDKLCEHISKTENKEAYAKDLQTLQNINTAFSASPGGVYKYNIVGFEHRDAGIKNLVYTLKLVRSISLGLKTPNMKTLEEKLKEVNFESQYIPDELLISKTKEDFQTKYEEVKKMRSNKASQPPPRPPPRPPPAPPRPPPAPPRLDNNDKEVRNKLLTDALTLLKSIFSQQEEQLPEAAFKLLRDIVLEKEGRVVGEVDAKVAITDVATETEEVVPKKTYVETTDNSLEKRIKRYEDILKILNSNLKSSNCLKKQTFKIDGTDHEGYTIGKDIELKEKIGETSDKDPIYLLTIDDNLILAGKLMTPTTKNRNEIKINEWITKNLILNSLSKHFALTFKSTECITSEVALGDNEKLVNYIELFDADIRTLLEEEIKKKVIDTALIWNILYQCLICIATYQNKVGYYHNHITLMNFKYQTNSKDGYYYYKYNEDVLYIKSCKYNIIIDDFNHSVLIDNNTESNRIALQKDYADFLRDFSSFLQQKNMNNSQENGLLIQKIIESLNDMSTQISHDNDDIFENIKNIFFVVNESGIILATLEKKQKPLNTTPFIINKADKQNYLSLNNDNRLEERISRYNYLNKTYSIGFAQFPTNDIYYPINKTILQSSDLTEENVRNCIIQEWITKNLILNYANQSKHFAILYGTNNYLNTLNIRDNKREPIPKYTEKCESKLSNFVLNTRDKDYSNIAINMLYQAFICIATYHNMVNFVFKKITIDKFLLQTNDYNGYYHYKYNDKEFYIKSCEYNIIIDDFGNSQIIDFDDDNSKNMILQNYIDIVEILQAKFNFTKSTLYTPQVYKDFNQIKSNLNVILINNTPFSFENNILSVFNKQNNSQIYTDEIPSNSILNSKPFIIRSKTGITNLENEISTLKKSINKAVLNEDEIEDYNKSLQVYNEQRRLFNTLIKNFDDTKYTEYFTLKEIDGIRIFELNNSQQQNENDIQQLKSINDLLSKMDNANKEILKKRENVNYTILINIIKKKTEENKDTNTNLISFASKLSFNKSGGNPPKYKSTGKAVYIMYKKRKYKRTIYVKDKRKTKYCKINNEYILLSKLKVIE